MLNITECRFTLVNMMIKSKEDINEVFFEEMIPLPDIESIDSEEQDGFNIMRIVFGECNDVYFELDDFPLAGNADLKFLIFGANESGTYAIYKDFGSTKIDSCTRFSSNDLITDDLEPDDVRSEIYASFLDQEWNYSYSINNYGTNSGEYTLRSPYATVKDQWEN